MLEFSISAMLDGLIHLGAFLCTCAGLYFLLSVIAKDKFEAHFGRTLIAVFFLVVAKVYMANFGWSSNIVAVVIVLFCLSFVLLLQMLKTPPLAGCLAAMVLVPVALGMEHVAIQFSAKVLPEGATFSEYMGLAQEAMDDTKIKRGLKPVEVSPSSVMRKSLDALASLTEEDEVEAMTEDFGRGMELFAERKVWMDSLTPEERQAYREEMAAFLAEQGLADDRYSLAAIKNVNPTNLVALASLFSELKNEGVDTDSRVRSIHESVIIIAGNLRGFKLDDEDLGMLRQCAELFSEGEIEEAIGQVRKDLQDPNGDSKLAGAVLAAMIQTESDLPIGQLFVGTDGVNLLDMDTLREFASNHWSREEQPIVEDTSTKLERELEVVDFQVIEIIDIPEEVAAAPEEEVNVPEEVVEKDPFLKVKIQFGVVLVPNEETEVLEWITASQQLRIQGYASLGGEVVILREDGSMIRRMETWSVGHGDYTYSFTVEQIMKNRVALRAAGREPVVL